MHGQQNIIIILVITFVQGIYNFIYVPETKHVSTVYSVAAVLYLQFALHVMLFRKWNMFCTFTLALSAVCVCAVPNTTFFFFSSSLISCSPGILLRYYLSDFATVPVAPAITGIVFAFTFHVRWISIKTSLYFKIFSTSFLITFLCLEIATAINMRVPLLLLWIIIIIIIIIITIIRSCSSVRKTRWGWKYGT